MNYFEHCQSIEEAKKRYRELLMQYHPDHTGEEGEAVTKEIIAQFTAFLDGFMSQSFNSYYEDKEWKPKAVPCIRFRKYYRKS
jgi:DnaJ-class molecular chaperone